MNMLASGTTTTDVRQIAEHDTDVQPNRATTVERRRPGRIANVNPALIPLLRSGALSMAAGRLEAAEREPRSDLDPAYGILVAALSNALFWAVLIYCLSN